MMSLLHVSALQHDIISLCVLFHNHTSCSVLFLIPPYYKWGIQIYFTVQQYDIYFVIFLDYTLHLLIYCLYKALTWIAFSQKKKIYHTACISVVQRGCKVHSVT